MKQRKESGPGGPAASDRCLYVEAAAAANSAVLTPERHLASSSLGGFGTFAAMEARRRRRITPAACAHSLALVTAGTSSSEVEVEVEP